MVSGVLTSPGLQARGNRAPHHVLPPSFRPAEGGRAHKGRFFRNTAKNGTFKIVIYNHATPSGF